MTEKNVIVTSEVVNIAPEKLMPEKPVVLPKYTFVYFFQDGGVVKLIEESPDKVCFETCYMAMVSVPGTGNSAPYVEVIKASLGAASLILTANIPVNSVAYANVVKAPQKRRKPMKPETCECCDAMTFSLQRGSFEDGVLHWLCDACRYNAGVYALDNVGTANWEGFLKHLGELKKK